MKINKELFSLLYYFIRIDNIDLDILKNLKRCLFEKDIYSKEFKNGERYILNLIKDVITKLSNNQNIQIISFKKVEDYFKNLKILAADASKSVFENEYFTAIYDEDSSTLKIIFNFKYFNKYGRLILKTNEQITLYE